MCTSVYYKTICILNKILKSCITLMLNLIQYSRTRAKSVFIMLYALQGDRNFSELSVLPHMTGVIGTLNGGFKNIISDNLSTTLVSFWVLKMPHYFYEVSLLCTFPLILQRHLVNATYTNTQARRKHFDIGGAES